MIVDALVGADPVFKLADATESAQDFAKLDDSILKVGHSHASDILERRASCSLYALL